MIPSKSFCPENQYCDDGKNAQTDYFLNYLQLYQRERSAITLVTNPVGGHLEAVLKKSDTPTEQDYAYQRQCAKPRKLIHA
jgi:hypothetical protein